MPRAARRQPDLFAPAAAPLDDANAVLLEEAEEDRRERLARLEAELNGLLERVRRAERLPFRTLTQALLAELRFMRAHHDIPDGAAKYAAFQAEMQRLYAIEDERHPP
ncbi:hypothetical protein [Elioraea sp.]|uniref:hypothetical protein n=1 Tax=Elioraea sp. TaxID=2185103 RepID=UPI00307E049A